MFLTLEGSVNIYLERQEVAFAHLTHLAVWIQDREPVEEEIASRSRDEVRREVAAFWRANFHRSNQA